MTDMAERITIVSAERVRDELVKLCSPLIRSVGCAWSWRQVSRAELPELPALALERDEHFRHKDVYEHP